MVSLACLDCAKCKEVKPSDQFYEHKVTPSGYSPWCKDCQRANAKEHYHRGQARERRLKLCYNITVADYDALLALQGGKCAICGSTVSGREDAQYFAVDHCHITGVIRGLLCHQCNPGLGLFADDPQRMEAAAAYLRQHQSGA